MYEMPEQTRRILEYSYNIAPAIYESFKDLVCPLRI
jgi:hypothetical protein